MVLNAHQQSYSVFIEEIRARPGVVLGAWILLWVIVATGELLPADNAAMELISETAISDKILHGCAYAALGFVPVLGFHRRRAIFSLIFAELMGMGLELGQLLVPGRSCDASDVLANTIGLVGGGLIGALLLRTQRTV